MKLTAPVSYSIVKYILENPDTSQIDIARNLHVSKAMVSYVSRDLADRGVLSQYGKARMKLRDPLKLLEAIAFERPLLRLKVDDFRTEYSDIKTVEETIGRAATKSVTNYAFTCYSALSKYLKYYLTYPTVHVYSDNPNELRRYTEDGRGDVNLVLLKPDLKTILQSAIDKQGLKTVTRIQTVIDLFCLGGAGRDGAIKLYEMTPNVESRIN
jgi:DNA-binding Lrp family transcriptional regulator